MLLDVAMFRPAHWMVYVYVQLVVNHYVPAQLETSNRKTPATSTARLAKTHCLLAEHHHAGHGHAGFSLDTDHS